MNKKSYVMCALAALCGIAAAAALPCGDIGIAMMLFMVLCGLFAWFALQWKGAIIVAAAGAAVGVTCIPYLFEPDINIFSQYWMLRMFALDVMLTSALIGMIGCVAGYLFSFAFGKEHIGKKHTRLLRPLAALGAFMIVFGSVEFTMMITGDPILHWKAKNTAETYIAEHYPEEGYLLDSEYYDYIGEYYVCCYRRPGDPPHVFREITYEPQYNLPVIRYFCKVHFNDDFRDDSEFFDDTEE